MRGCRYAATLRLMDVILEQSIALSMLSNFGGRLTEMLSSGSRIQN